MFGKNKYNNSNQVYESKYSKVLTIVLVAVIVAVLALLGFLGYDVYKKFEIKNASAEVLNEVDNVIANEQNDNSNNTEGNTEDIPLLEVNTETTNTTTNTSKVTYKGYNVSGKIEIPTIDLAYPILDRTTPQSIELAVAISYSQNGLNEVGNTVIVGHNYRNGSFFGNNDKLVNGNKVYITDLTGRKITYVIYNIYEAAAEESDYFTKDTNGKREIVLATCTDNSKARLIIWAAEE